MKKLFPLACFALLLAACQPKKAEDQPAADTTATPAPAAPVDSTNQLTATEQAEGWKLLFDGQTLNGWRTFKNKETDSWDVVDGTLHCKPAASVTKPADIITNDQYENFELAFDWKIAPQGNSGVIYRSTEEFDQPFISGPEYQVIDDTGYPEKLKDVQLSAANYDMHVTSANVAKPAGEWNTGKIVVNGTKVEHWLNGTKVVEYELQSEDWKKRKAASKWKEFAGYGAAKKGHIDLQNHGSEAWFKNIKIKTL